jgi:hypothetical protein
MKGDFGYLSYFSLLEMVLFLAVFPWADSPISHVIVLAVTCSTLVAAAVTQILRGNP